MGATELVVNRRAALRALERKAIRTAVFQLERRLVVGEIANLDRDINRVAGRMGYLAQMHPGEGENLKRRINLLRRAAAR